MARRTPAATDPGPQRLLASQGLERRDPLGAAHGDGCIADASSSTTSHTLGRPLAAAAASRRPASLGRPRPSRAHTGRPPATSKGARPPAHAPAKGR